MQTKAKWRVYHRPTTNAFGHETLNPEKRLKPAFLGWVHADNKHEALTRARLFYDPRPLDVVAQSDYDSMTSIERAVVEGSFEPPVEHAELVERPNGVAWATCRKCHLPVEQPHRVKGKRCGRPLRYHEHCMTPQQVKMRRYSRRRTAAKHEAEQLELSA